MIVSNIIAILALILSLYTIISSPSRYELGNNYRIQLIGWYEKTEEIIKKLQLHSYSNDAELKTLLALLSTQIEVGRFYFPNNNSSQNIDNKPLAYQGERNVVLSYLVNIYQAYNNPSSIEQYLNGDLSTIDSYVENRSRKFTSGVFKIIAPDKWNKSRDKYANTQSPHHYNNTDMKEVIGKDA